MLRRAAVAGTWYPGEARALEALVDRQLSRACGGRRSRARPRAIIAPHAGMPYSGATAACAYATLAVRPPSRVVIVGPSHYLGFEGVATWPGEAFETPLGRLPLDADFTARLTVRCRGIAPLAEAHVREHAIEMHLPFLQRVAPGARLVPLVMGTQDRAMVESLADALVALADADTVVAASTDLSHFFDAATADALDAETARAVATGEGEHLLRHLERYPFHERGRFVMCGGGPAAVAMLAAQGGGPVRASVLERTHSGVISGDMHQVVGYLSAALDEADDDAAH
jgi:AmmeMemoRadiSam system protein B